jgi:hypothetical protein
MLAARCSEVVCTTGWVDESSGGMWRSVPRSGLSGIVRACSKSAGREEGILLAMWEGWRWRERVFEGKFVVFVCLWVFGIGLGMFSCR